MSTMNRATLEAQDVQAAPRLSKLAGELRGSAILGIAAEIRALRESGRDLCDLTVGDFSPAHFPIPQPLLDGVVKALQAGETNYPASPGMDVLRRTVAEFYRRRRGLTYPSSQILIASGARPLIYAIFRILVDPGDRVVYGVPSWNNDYYCEMTGAAQVPVVCGADVNFLPTASLLRNAVRGARLLSLNSPLNPTGTLFDAATLAGICDLVLEENARRGGSERPLYLLYDQIYWMLTFGEAKHFTPVELRPEMARYTVFVDGISKAFAATGLRVGWSVAAPAVTQRMSDLLGHVGAWAPRPEQVAVAGLLDDDAEIADYHATMKHGIEARLNSLYVGLAAMKAQGLPVDVIPPRAAIYLTAHFDLLGARTAEGATLANGEEIRQYLLKQAGVAIVPFSAFGAVDDSGWCRLSVGAVSLDDIALLLPRLEHALKSVTPAGAGIPGGAR